MYLDVLQVSAGLEDLQAFLHSLEPFPVHSHAQFLDQCHEACVRHQYCKLLSDLNALDSARLVSLCQLTRPTYLRRISR